MLPLQLSLKNRALKAIACFGASALIGWPFAAILGIPFALEEILTSRTKPVSKKRDQTVLGRLVNILQVSLLAATAILVCLKQNLRRIGLISILDTCYSY